MPPRLRAAAVALALVGIMSVVGAAVFAAVRDEGPAAVPSTTTATTAVPQAAVEAAIAGALQDRLDALTPTEARCVARELLQVFDLDALESMRSLDEPVAALDEGRRARLVRGIVGCVPEATAAALLGGDVTTTTADVPLPDEGG